jgi:hypothetical protein
MFLGKTDYTAHDCGFTKSEIRANLQRISSVVDTIRENPVLSELSGIPESVMQNNFFSVVDFYYQQTAF